MVHTEDVSNEKTFTAFEVVEVCVRNCTTAILIWHGECIVASNMLSFYLLNLFFLIVPPSFNLPFQYVLCLSALSECLVL